MVQGQSPQQQKGMMGAGATTGNDRHGADEDSKK